MANSHIKEYLDYYCNLKVPPQYAVMIKGKWGSGKTWFIKQYLKDLDTQGVKYLYVSLYGISGFKGITSEFYRQLHPVLSSKGLEIAGKIVKGALKATIKVDLDSDGKSDGTVAIDLKDIPDFLQNTNERVLIFDDVERCSIPIADLLGFINNFVEYKTYKAILVSNEEEIGASKNKIKNNGEDAANNYSTEHLQYLRIKEKLIGKTFEVKPDFNSAVNSFKSEILHGPTKHSFEQNIDNINSIFEKSGFKNFRHLRQSMLEMERAIKLFPSKAYQQKELMSDFIKYFLIFISEIRSGSEKAKDISEMKLNIKFALDPTKGKIGTYERIQKKYGINCADILFPPKLWGEILDLGHIDAEKIKQAINQSKYFIDNKSENWKSLWHMGRLTDSEISQLTKIVRDEFDKKTYDDIGVVCHVVGILMKLSTVGIIKIRKRTLMEEGKRYVKHLEKKGKLLGIEEDIFSDNAYDGCYNLGFTSLGTQEFQEFMDFCASEFHSSNQRNLPDLALTIQNSLKINPYEFCKKIQGSDGIHDYYKTPILKYFNKSKFVEDLSSLPNQTRHAILKVLGDRYTMKKNPSILHEEHDWLTDVAKIFRLKAKQKKRTLTAHFLEDAATDFESLASEIKLATREIVSNKTIIDLSNTDG